VPFFPPLSEKGEVLNFIGRPSVPAQEEMKCCFIHSLITRRSLTKRVNIATIFSEIKTAFMLELFYELSTSRLSALKDINPLRGFSCNMGNRQFFL
jgi:hypothetical protein